MLSYRLAKIQKKVQPRSHRILLDNVTRWGSTYIMLQRAFNNRKHIDQLINSERHTKNLYNLTTIPERTWVIVFIMIKLLNHFNSATVYLQGDKYSTLNMTISLYLQLIDSIKNDYEKRVIPEMKDVFKAGIDAAVSKIENYFSKGSFTSFMSMVLDPRLKDSIYKKHNWMDDFNFMFEK